MTAIRTFEDITAWKKSRELSKAVYQATSKGKFAKDYGFRDQIRRAAISVTSNIAEGFDRSGDREFKHFLSIAQASASEVRAQLYVALDVELIDHAEFSRLHRLATDTHRLVGGFIRYLESTRPTKPTKD